ncbi:type VI secretion system lipoprotein TssJ [Hafnia alvei]|uniref:Type VI secretion system lipoprotein TssJ n=2 Tax=Hafnia alvei TaxID=569 RepID=A0ABD7Q6R3_HAFAL|nr:type VI secretion system lipoprotein TssJ [Hafnia alvei]
MLVIVMLTAFLVSCSSSGNEKMNVAGKIKANLFANRDVNPNETGHPAPLNVFIYNVKEVDGFNNADFIEVVDENNKDLQAVSSKVYEAILQPGESRTVFITIDHDSRALGVIGAYRNLNDSTWSVVWEFPEKKVPWWKKMFRDDPLELNVHFQKSTMTIKKMD